MNISHWCLSGDFWQNSFHVTFKSDICSFKNLLCVNTWASKQQHGRPWLCALCLFHEICVCCLLLESKTDLFHFVGCRMNCCSPSSEETITRLIVSFWSTRWFSWWLYSQICQRLHVLTVLRPNTPRNSLFTESQRAAAEWHISYGIRNSTVTSDIINWWFFEMC